MVCTGRFYDFLEKRHSQWGFVLRQPIYEKDRVDPVDPAATLSLDPEILKLYPEGYRHLAYLQHKIGYKVKRDMPGLDGPELEALYAKGKAWLEGKPSDRQAGLTVSRDRQAQLCACRGRAIAWNSARDKTKKSF